ncbi:MAG: RagB/SusD family nutrient uptake outer membrane protein [Bacteroides sp.]
MKKYIYTFIICGMLNASCSNLLDLDSKTSVTNTYLTTPEGLSASVTGLYSMARELSGGMSEDGSNLYIITMCDFNTDLMIFRGGVSAAIGRLNLSFTPSAPDVNKFWKHHYEIIGKANEIISIAEKIGLENSSVLQAWSEAKFFRSRSYFELWKRFDRLYINTEITTVDNLQREFKPATTEELMTLISTDLDDAITNLDWSTAQRGRVTKATAKHVRAQVAMWEKDWTKVIEECEDIFEQSSLYSMENKTENIFNSAELTSREVLWSFQYSKNLGGGGSGTPLGGHRLAIQTTAHLSKVSGCIDSPEQGGYGWGRVYPNTYLLSLYDQAKDTRYKELFVHRYVYNDKNFPDRFGKEVPLPKNSSTYLETLHFMSKKFFDQWTLIDNPSFGSSFKDLIVYRLAETYLMASEAYMNRDGGMSPDALRCYNQTWKRAGNDTFMGPLTQDILVDEYARELNFEGVRWPLLKRLGLLGERVKAHYGESKAENPCLDKDFTECRTSFVIGKHERWPIPQEQVDLMGKENFPQNKGWD